MVIKQKAQESICPAEKGGGGEQQDAREKEQEKNDPDWGGGRNKRRRRSWRRDIRQRRAVQKVETKSLQWIEDSAEKRTQKMKHVTVCKNNVD